MVLHDWIGFVRIIVYNKKVKNKSGIKNAEFTAREEKTGVEL